LTPHPIHLAVYGTLKRGHWNHKVFCANAVRVEPLLLPGRLYAFESGIPALVLNASDILAFGTCDPLSDAATQYEIALLMAEQGSCVQRADRCLVHAELITFADPAADVLPIDRLEGFRPGQDSVYDRVLVAAVAGSGEVSPVWCYVASRNSMSHIEPSGRVGWPW